MRKVIVLLAVLCFVGCKTKYVTVPEYHTEYVTRTDSILKWDSIWVHDSVMMMLNGDTITVYREREKLVYKYLDKVKVDSFIKTDSIRVPYPVERELSKWEKVKMEAGGVGIGAIALIILYSAFCLVRKLRARRRF